MRQAEFGVRFGIGVCFLLARVLRGGELRPVGCVGEGEHDGGHKAEAEAEAEAKEVEAPAWGKERGDLE